MFYLLISFLLVACGNKEAKKEQVEASEPAAKKEEKKVEKSGEVAPIPAKKVEEIEGSKEAEDKKEEK